MLSLLPSVGRRVTAGGPDYRVYFIPEGGPSKLPPGRGSSSEIPNSGTGPAAIHFLLELSESLAIT
jgi:hypothetical protein